MLGLVKETLGAMGSKAKGAVNKVMGIVKGVPSVPSQKETERLIAYKKNLCKKALNLFNLDPSRSVSEYYQALQDADPLK